MPSMATRKYLSRDSVSIEDFLAYELVHHRADHFLYLVGVRATERRR